MTSRRATAQESIESEPFLAFGEIQRPSDHVSDGSQSQERWTAAENERWKWYERESLREGQWKLTGITRPVHRVTGECVEQVLGYLDESLVPIEYRRVDHGWQDERPALVRGEPSQGPESYGHVSLERRVQDGRPPSEWLRSMDTEELTAGMVGQRRGIPSGCARNDVLDASDT